ncbi:hypothetical protein K3495_g9174 [Podosphaera aphanis]|nr:hypothetical protein K3495_g9174 [Podosphaera aphanis]
MSGTVVNQFILTDDNSWADWFGQIKSLTKSYLLGYVLIQSNPGQSPAIFPRPPEFPEAIKESDYLTPVLTPNTTGTEAVLELTAVKRAKLNDDRMKDAYERDLISKKKVNYERLRETILRSIDGPNRSHLQTYIQNSDYTTVGELVDILRIHRKQSKSIKCVSLITRLRQLKSKGFQFPYDEQLARLNEWFNLVTHCKAANHSTYTGYEIIDEQLLTLRPLNEAIYHLLHSEMTNNEEADIPADFRSWVEIVKGKLATTHYGVPSQVSRATFATLQGQDMNHVHSKPSKKKGSGKGTLKRENDDSPEGQAKCRKKKQDCPCG